SDTVIFITWDDWGGFYDHVPPPFTYIGHQNSQQQWVCGSADAPNGWGCGYVFGFRVPLLVVSQYTWGYVSGALPPYGPGAAGFQHDSGSILAFVENNFNLGPIAPPPYTYADQNTLDAVYNKQPVVPLWDFFLGSPKGFVSIPTNPNYPASYFINFYQTTLPGQNQPPTPTGPEDGDPWD